MGCVEDEMHFMLECPLYRVQRRSLLSALDISVDADVCDANMRMISNGRTTDQWRAIIKYIKSSYQVRAVKLQGA